MHIGIIGGGIGGVATAVAMQHFGIRATIYERAPQLKEVGAGMMLWPNATRVLKALGLLERVGARGGANTHFLVRASDGKTLMNIATGAFDVPALCVRRSDLLGALLSALPPRRIHLDHELTRFETPGSRVRLNFADGSSVEHDALIGADGIRSRVRAQMFGNAVPIYRGYTVWRGVAEYRGSAIRPGYNSESWGHGSRFGILDIGGKRYTFYATANISRREAPSPEDRKRELLERFGGWHEPVEALIDGAKTILENGAYDLLPLRRWTRGRVTLLGDAAHPCTPNLGQGGCMALEDAMVLARCVSAERSLECALRRYEALRRRRTRHIQQRSLWMGQIGQWQNRTMVAARGIVTGLLPAAIFEHNLKRVYSYDA